MWTLVFFETANGKRPVEEYLAKLGTKEKARVRFGLELLEQLGLELRATKKTQQTPAAEKETAIRRMNDWKERMSQE